MFPDPKWPLAQFTPVYLTALKRNIRGFRTFFGWLVFLNTLALIAAIIGFLIMAAEMAQRNIPISSAFVANSVFALISLLILRWLARLCLRFVRLQMAKTENLLLNQVEFQDQTERKADEILSAAEKRAGHNINVSGNVAAMVLDGGTISGVTQNAKIHGDRETMKILSLLIEFARETGNSVAFEAANQMAAEATSEKPDKGRLFYLWNTIAAAVPTILGAVKIVDGVRKILI
ncbi:MAG: hypothetical protein AAFQ66_17710 [Pseudomonadota bacterium]